MKKLLFTVLIGVSIVGCGQKETEVRTNAKQKANTAVSQETNKYAKVNNEDFKKFIATNKDVLILDVRTPGEYNAGNIEGAKNIDFFGDSFKEEIGKLDKNQPIALYCKSGGRSGKTLEMMKALGFKNVAELKHGYNGWKK